MGLDLSIHCSAACGHGKCTLVASYEENVTLVNGYASEITNYSHIHIHRYTYLEEQKAIT